MLDQMHRMRAVPQEDQPSWFFLERGPNSHGDPPKSVKVVCVRLVSLTQATPSVHGGGDGIPPPFFMDGSQPPQKSTATL